MSGAPLGVPTSPASTKRSRSRDSSLASSVSTSATETPLQTPAGSAPSLIIPSSSPPNQSASPGSPQDPTPYPAFLRLSKTEIQKKYNELEADQRRRLLHGLSPKREESDEQSPWAKCPPEEVANRNRYGNVDPFLGNRVKLQVPEGHSDYINASPITLESTRSGKMTKFIATQGPKADIISHIWRMIWHETASPAVIVMLTQTHEGSREKCAPYYPLSEEQPELSINAHDEFADGFTHNLKLVSLSEHDEARAQVRALDMVSTDESETKKVWHLLFAGWPDFSVPEGSDRDALVRLIDISREKNKEHEDSPRIVHCSAGVGRSGTFIALDWLVQELEEGSLDEVAGSEDPIYKVVDNLRKQRMMMVQADSQYLFLYDVLRERWRERWVHLHPEEAERLGVSAIQEPKAKKAKPNEDDALSQQLLDGADEDDRAQLEAELVDAEAAFEQGKT